MKSCLQSIAIVGALYGFAPSTLAYGDDYQVPLDADINPNNYKAACPDYTKYAMRQQYVFAICFLTIR